MKKILISTISLLTWVSVGLMGQDTLKLSLHDALTASARSNQDIALATLAHESAVARAKQMDAVFLPQVNVSYTGMTTSNPLNAFGFKLQQQSVSPSDFNPQLLNHPSLTQNYMTKVELNQPILNLDLIHQRNAARRQSEVIFYQGQRTKEYIAFEVAKAYSELQMVHQAVSVLQEAFATAKSIHKTSELYYAKGYMQKSDLLMVQVQAATVESKLAEAMSNVQNASDYLNFLMGSKTGSIIITDNLEKTELINVDHQVPENRSDFNAMTSALNAQAFMIQSVWFSMLPRLNAFGNYQFNDKTAGGFGSGSYLFGAQLSWNIFNGFSAVNRTNEQKINYTRTRRQLNQSIDQSQVELNKTFRQLEDYDFALRQHANSVEQASEALRILQNRFEQGLISINDLLKAQSTVSEQKLLMSEVVAKYNIALAYIKFLTTTEHQN